MDVVHGVVVVVENSSWSELKTDRQTDLYIYLLFQDFIFKVQAQA